MKLQIRMPYGDLAPSRLVVEETLLHNANGYLGVRGALEEGYPEGYPSVRGSYLNGVYDIVPMPQAEPLYGLVDKKQTMVNVAEVQSIKVFVNGELASPFTGSHHTGERILDMENGVTRRILEWEGGLGGKARLHVTRMASFTRLPIFALRFVVTADTDETIVVESRHDADVWNFFDPNDPRVASTAVRHIVVDSVTQQEAGSSILTHTSQSGIRVVTVVRETASLLPSGVERHADAFGVTGRYTFSLRKGEQVEFIRMVGFADSLRNADPVKTAEEACRSAMTAGFATLEAEQSGYLSDFWRHVDVGIDGDDELSLDLAFNLYELLQSAGRDRFGHLAAKGLSGEGYEGHSFWDTEIYVQPFFTLTMPQLSRNLLSYRYAILPKAKENARLLGHAKGALYPWRTINGVECSGFFLSGTAQYHIDGAVAYAVVQYYQVTGDEDFMESMGLEMLLEIARLWLDLGVYVDGLFRLNCVTGPDEYTCLVDNNYYTNASAKYDLAWAVRYYRELEAKGKAEDTKTRTGITEAELAAFQAASDAMYLPYDETRGITPQDDSFLQKKVWDLSSTPREKFPLLLHYHPLTLYRYQVCKQADAVLAHFLYEPLVDETTRLKSFRYYEKITTHDSSLSKCIFSIVAAKLGLVEEAYTYLGDSIKIDLNDLNHNTKDGIHTANMGGSYLALVFGFGGLRIHEDGLSLNPCLPSSWKGYHFTIQYRKTVLHVAVSKEQVALTAEGEVPLPVMVYGKNVEVSDTLQRITR
jgi:alpha,alpha-trehalose phosphorylase